MTYLYIILTLIFIMQIIMAAYFIYLIKMTSKRVLDVNSIVETLRRLQEDERIYITADHGIKFNPTFNAALDKDKTVLKIDLTALNTKWIINDPEILMSIKNDNKKEIENFETTNK